MRNKVLIVILALIGILFFFWALGKSQNTSPSPELTQNEPPLVQVSTTTYALSVSAKALGPDSVEVSGQTNLPDGAVIEILSRRILTMVGEDDERFPFPGSGSVTTEVKNGIYVAKITMDDRKLVDFLKVAAPESIVKKFDPNIEIEATFHPRRTNDSFSQSASVLSIVGANGENLASSPQKKVFGSATATPSNYLEAVIRIPLPFLYPDQIPQT